MEHERRETQRNEPTGGDAAAGSERTTNASAGKWSGRHFNQSELEHIRKIIAADKEANRREIAHRVCKALDWRRPNGELKEMRARVVLLRMHESGIIQLPPPRKGNGNRKRREQSKQNQRRQKERPVEYPPSVEKRVDELGPLTIETITRHDTERNERWRYYMDKYHYLGWTPVVGEQMRYWISAQGEDLALISFGAASWKVASRDEWIGWTSEQREGRLPWIINNTRYLILPWVKSKNLASAILGKLSKRVGADWRKAYGIAPVLLETFVDSERFAGTCYKAANWIHVGKTQGRGKYDTRHENQTPRKDVWLYPLRKKPSQFLTSLERPE